jgi:hypothetical protein
VQERVVFAKSTEQESWFETVVEIELVEVYPAVGALVGVLVGAAVVGAGVGAGVKLKVIACRAE